MARVKGKIVVRQRAALQRLEAAYETFKAAGEDKKPWSSTRNGKQIIHSGRSYNAECERMKKEIAILKEKISKAHLALCLTFKDTYNVSMYIIKKL